MVHISLSSYKGHISLLVCMWAYIFGLKLKLIFLFITFIDIGNMTLICHVSFKYSIHTHYIKEIRIKHCIWVLIYFLNLPYSLHYFSLSGVILHPQWQSPQLSCEQGQEMEAPIGFSRSNNDWFLNKAKLKRNFNLIWVNKQLPLYH